MAPISGSPKVGKDLIDLGVTPGVLVAGSPEVHVAAVGGPDGTPTRLAGITTWGPCVPEAPGRPGSGAGVPSADAARISSIQGAGRWGGIACFGNVPSGAPTGVACPRTNAAEQGLHQTESDAA